MKKSVFSVQSVLSVCQKQQRTIAIAQKAEIVCKCVIVNCTPISVYKRRNQEHQRTFWLMKIGYHSVYNQKFVTRFYHYLRRSVNLSISNFVSSLRIYRKNNYFCCRKSRAKNYKLYKQTLYEHEKKIRIVCAN